MLQMLKDWNGTVEYNNESYTSVNEFIKRFKSDSDTIHIKLCCKQSKAVTEQTRQQESREYRITVKPYMTKHATPEFDFMSKWNNDKPMPMRIMQGTIEKETPGMVYMHLKGLGEPTITCTCCGKELTNPISRYYGIGPICLNKLGISRDIEDIESIKKDLVDIEWTGWVIKSAITKKEEV